MKPNKDIVAIRINEIRVDLDLSIAGMAEKLNISKSTLNSYIRALAMPPKDILYKISIMSGKSIEYICYGDVRDYIKQVIEFEGYSQFLNDYPETIDKVVKSCQEYEEVYPLVEHRYPHHLHINLIFSQIYNPIFGKYVEHLIKVYIDEIHKYPSIIGDDECQTRFKYINLVHLDIQRMGNLVTYGDRIQIMQIAENVFKNRVDNHFRINKLTLKQFLMLSKS